MRPTTNPRVFGSAGVGVLVAIAAVGLGIVPTAAPAQGSASAVSEQATFAKDVMPVLQRSCQVCHRPGSIAPMSLLTYEDARPWARAIKEKVATRTMPPWYVDRNVGVQGFKSDRSLTDEEIATIVAWVDAGAPRGNPADMPPPRQFDDPDKWFIGVPDWIVPIPEPFVVEAEAADWWGNMVTDSGLTEDRWLQAVETKPGPGAFEVVHHAGTSVIEDEDDETGTFISEYALGKNGDIFPEGSGRLLKAGGKVRFGLHYHSIGRDVTDRTSVAYKFYPRGVVPKHELISRHVGDNADLDFPPGENNIRHDGYHRLEHNIRLTGFQPHLHNRGKRQCVEAIHVDGRVETLSCANWDFGWHIVYNYEDNVAPLLPKGTILHVISWHDNSRANRWNPDPENWAGFGQRSIDDMSFSWLSWFALTDEDFQAELKAREALTSNNE